MKWILSIMLSVSVLALSNAALAQFETTTPLCTPTALADVQGLAGVYQFRIQGLENHQPALFVGALEFLQVSPGLYSIGDPGHQHGVWHTCTFGNFIVGEAETEFGTFNQTFILSSGGLLSLGVPAVDPQALMRAGVSFTVVDRPNRAEGKGFSLQGFRSSLTQDNQTHGVLVIDVRSASDKAALQAASLPGLLGFIFTR